MNGLCKAWAIPMSINRISLHPAFILHSRPYRDTSVIIDAFTCDYGRISMVVRGGRANRSRWQGRLQPFRPLLISWSGRSELATMTELETQSNSIPLKGLAMMSGFYLNELMQRLLQSHDPHPQLFSYYQITLENLSQNPELLELNLRQYECRLLDELGYGLNLLSEFESGAAVRSDQEYCYHLQQGVRPLGIGHCSGIKISGTTLLALADQLPHNEDTLMQAKRLLRAELHMHLGDKPLKTREMLKRTHNLIKVKGDAS